MAKKLTVLTDKDKELVQYIFDEVRDMIKSSSTQGQGRSFNKTSRNTTDVYIARVGDYGIPALDSDAEPNLPGRGLCDLFMIMKSEDGDDQLVDIKKSEIVFNLTDSDLDEGSWVTIHRDKHGDWIAAVSSAAVGSVIMFEIVSPGEEDGYETCEWVNAIVVGTTCSGVPTLGSEIRVYDDMGCNFNIPPEDLLVGPDGYPVRGVAAKMKVSDEYGYYDQYTYYDYYGYPEGSDCRWEVLRLCCTGANI